MDLVLLDLDGTLLKGQSQKYLFQYLFKNKYVSIIPFIKIYAWFIFYKLGLISDPKKAMGYAFAFLKGWKVEDFQNLVSSFFKDVLSKEIYSESYELINEHKDMNRYVLIVSNAMEPIVKECANYLGVNNYISTTLEIVDGCYTGLIDAVAYGANKIDLINSYITKNQLEIKDIWAYGDHDSDIHVLEMAKHPFAVNPSKNLMKVALRRSWPVLKFSLQ